MKTYRVFFVNRDIELKGTYVKEVDGILDVFNTEDNLNKRVASFRNYIGWSEVASK